MRQCPGLFDAPQTIFVISPQTWDALKVSKHHYAQELAVLGHTVYFIEPPGANDFSVRADSSGVVVVSYRTPVPYRIKFRARPLFDFCMRQFARGLAARLGRTPDIVWDFDNAYQFTDLSAFGAAATIFHPVDDLPVQGGSDKRCDLLLSVSQRFLNRIPGGNRRGHVIPHGLGSVHADYARGLLAGSLADAPSRSSNRVAYVGNLDHPGIDWITLFRIINENQDSVFEFIGPWRDATTWVEKLRAHANVRVLGPMRSEDILEKAADVDVWLICYDGAKTIDGAINSHKILEYLATGKAVLANHIEAYTGNDLVCMAAGPDSADMPALLSAMLADLDRFNASELQARRASFALQHSYRVHLKTIDGLLAKTEESWGI